MNTTPDANNELYREAQRLATRPYKIIVSSDTDGENMLCMAKNPELHGCMAQGNDFDDATKNLWSARIDWIFDMLLDGNEIPNPKGERGEYSSLGFE